MEEVGKVSLETPSRARASSCQAVGTTWFFSSCGGILELRRGSQKGVKPPVKFGEKTRDSSQGQAGKEVPNLAGRCHRTAPSPLHTLPTAEQLGGYL